MTTFTDEVRELVSPHKFGNDRMAAACYLVSLDGCADEETGDADWSGGYVARFGRRLLTVDGQGFVYCERFDREAEAMSRFGAIDSEYGAMLEADEQEAELASSGWVESDSVGVAEFHPGDAVRLVGVDGIAFRVSGVPSMDGPRTDWTGYKWWHPGRRLVHMVGDDAIGEVSVGELTPLDDDDFCASCGQIGCRWH